MAQVRFGLIGMGEWARLVHIPNLLRLEEAQITALASRSPESLNLGQAAVNQGRGNDSPTLYTDYHDLLRDPEVDAVILCTPNATHEALAVETLQAGKHLLCEKPLSFTRAGCDRVQAAVEQSGRTFQVGLELRYSDVCQKLHSLIRSGAIGDPKMAHCLIWRDWGAPQGWRSGHESSGGIHLELSIHYLDVLDWLLDGGDASLYTSGGKCLGTEITDHFWTNLDYASGAHANLGIAVFAPAENLIPLEFVGPKGRIAADVITGRVEVWTRDGKVADASPQRPSDYRFDGFPGSIESLAAFIRCVQGGTPPVAGIEAAIRATRLALAAQDSEDRGQPVTVIE